MSDAKPGDDQACWPASGSMPGWIISSQSGGTWKWNWKGSEVARRDVNGISDVRDDSWHHIAVSHDRKGLARFFVNGVQLRTISIEDDGDVDTVTLSWAGGPGIRLQMTPRLADPEWIDVEGTEGSSSFTGSIDQPSAYYRLSR